MTLRHVNAPKFQISRYGEWKDPVDPWLDPSKLPILEGGCLGDLIFGAKAVVMVDFDIDKDDPAYEYLHGFRTLMSMPSFDHGEALNMTLMLSREPNAFVETLLPQVVWPFHFLGRDVYNLRIREPLIVAHHPIAYELNVV